MFYLVGKRTELRPTDRHHTRGGQRTHSNYIEEHKRLKHIKNTKLSIIKRIIGPHVKRVARAHVVDTIARLLVSFKHHCAIGLGTITLAAELRYSDLGIFVVKHDIHRNLHSVP